jgi:alpha-galactosidase
VGSSVDLDNDGTSDVTFSDVCGFVLQLANGRVTAIEVDRAVTATVQGTNQTLAPFTPVVLVPPSTSAFEAESATLDDGASAQACGSCSGGARVDGSTLDFDDIEVPVAGTYTLTMYYSNPDATARTATLTVNGVASAPISFPSTGDSSVIDTVSVPVALAAGGNAIAIGGNGSLAPSFDRFALALAFEAEAATLGGAALPQACDQCSGGQRVGFIGNAGTATAPMVGTLSFTNVNVPADGNYVLTFFYSNQDVTDRAATVSVNGKPGFPVSFASTGSFSTVAPLNVTVRLNAGTNTIALGNPTARGPSIDRMVLNVP